MLELVHVGPRSIEAYRGVAPDAVLDDLVRVASELRGARELGQERERQHFLLPRLLLDELTLMRGLAAGRPIERDASWFATHDPVCGMSVAEAGEAVGDVVLGGKTLRFCCEACRRQFTAAPGHYIGS